MKMKMLTMMLKILSSLLLLNYVSSVHVRVDPLVLTNQGLVRGQSATDGDYSMFLGVPYAQIDVNNPFGESLPYPNYKDVFYAYDDSSECPQRNFQNGEINGDFDCLRLNIYVPRKASSTSTLPVIVWIHGGGFSGGSGGLYKAADLVRHDVVVVTINYRVGPYGFMCLDIPNVPGNQGLRDQHAALQWISDNIEAFGGDVNSITIAGQSAGAGSIDLHMHTEYEKLFHKAIIQSGSSKVEGMFVNADVTAANKIAKLLGFDTVDLNEAVNFLSTIHPHLVIAASLELQLEFRPCKEQKFDDITSFVANDSQNMVYNSNTIQNTPILIGYTTSEEYGNVARDNNYVSRGDVFLNKLENHFNFEDKDELLHIANIVRHFYIGDDDISDDSLSKLIDFESDFTFHHPIERTITKYVEQGATVYQYIFAYTGNSNVTIATHGEEVKYLFKMDSREINDERDILVADRMTTLWTNFAKFGNPTPSSTDLLPVSWESVSDDRRPYLHIDADLNLQYRASSQRMAFWDLFYEIYGELHALNTERTLE